MPIDPVVEGDPIATAWGNDVATTINGIETTLATKYGPGLTDVPITDGGTGASTAAAARTNLGLGTIATMPASNVAITGGSIVGIADLALADGGTGASTAAAARTNLGLATVAASGLHSDLTGVSVNDHHARAHDHADPLDGSTVQPAVLRAAGELYIVGRVLATPGANLNDHDTGASNAGVTVIRLAPTASIDLTGTAGGSANRVLIYENAATAFNVTARHQSASSTTAGNRYILPGNADVVIRPNGSLMLKWDQTTSRWRAIGGQP